MGLVLLFLYFPSTWPYYLLICSWLKAISEGLPLFDASPANSPLCTDLYMVLLVGSEWSVILPLGIYIRYSYMK